MKPLLYIPNSLQSAGRVIRHSIRTPIQLLSRRKFLRAWCSLTYLFPGLHPDGYLESDNGWPRAYRRFVAEVWRRAEAGELTDDELYPSDAQWAGICDRMRSLTPQESERRRQLAAAYGDNADA